MFISSSESFSMPSRIWRATSGQLTPLETFFF